MFYCVGMVSYSIVAGDTVPTVLKRLLQVDEDSFLTNRNLVIAILTFAVILPLSLQRYIVFVQR